MGFVDNFNQHLDSLLERLGDSAVYTPSGGNPVTLQGVFENEYFAVDGEGVSIAASQPRFTCKSSDVLSVNYGDALTVEGMAYKVVNIQHDGTGSTLLVLEKQ